MTDPSAIAGAFDGATPSGIMLLQTVANSAKADWTKQAPELTEVEEEKEEEEAQHAQQTQQPAQQTQQPAQLAAHQPRAPMQGLSDEALHKADLRNQIRAANDGLESTLPAHATRADLEAELGEATWRKGQKRIERTARSAFVLACHGLEGANRELGPFVHLDGWATHVEREVAPDAGELLLEIYQDMAGRRPPSPYVQLGLLLSQSMYSWHVRAPRGPEITRVKRRKRRGGRRSGGSSDSDNESVSSVSSAASSVSSGSSSGSSVSSRGSRRGGRAPQQQQQRPRPMRRAMPAPPALRQPAQQQQQPPAPPSSPPPASTSTSGRRRAPAMNL